MGPASMSMWLHQWTAHLHPKRHMSKTYPCLTHAMHRDDWAKLPVTVSSCSFQQHGYFPLQSLSHIRTSWLLRQFSDLTGLSVGTRMWGTFHCAQFIGSHSLLGTPCSVGDLEICVCVCLLNYTLSLETAHIIVEEEQGDWSIHTVCGCSEEGEKRAGSWKERAI